MADEPVLTADNYESGLDPNSLKGVRYLRRLFPMLERLSASGTERDIAGNRRLLFNHYAGLMLVGMFNPTLLSMRGLSEASALRKVQKAIGGPRASTGSLSEAVRVFDPRMLESIFQELLAELPAKTSVGTSPSIPLQLAQRLSAVDGTALRALPQIVAAVGSKRDAKWRLHLQFEVHREIPEYASLTPDETGGEDDERSVLSRNLRSGRIYLLDRGYERYTLFKDIVDANSDFVCRVQERNLKIVSTQELSPAAHEARVISDEIVQIPGLAQPIRRVVIQRRGQGRRRTDKTNSETIVLLTNLLEPPAEIIAALYELRWSIELFFRFFKHVLGCRHLMSHKAEGIMIQVYCALIAALLMSLTLGGDIGRRGFELICLYFQGWADEDELLDGLRRLAAKKQNQDA